MSDASAPTVTESIDADLKSRVISAELPPADLDLLAATQDVLEKYGLPPRPNPTTCPQSYAHWRRAAAEARNFIMPRFTFDLAPLAAWGSSDNWSGAYIRAPLPRQLGRVQASWVVPRPYPQRRQSPGGPWVEDDYRCSTWVGLDGYDNSSIAMPQAGTAQFVTIKNGALEVDTHAWWQWWINGENPPRPPVKIEDFPVSPGDMVFCQLVVRDPRVVNFTIANKSAGIQVAFDVRAPQLPTQENIPYEVKVEGKTAEWIMERPAYLNDSKKYYTLPNYGATFFSNCLAVTDPASGSTEIDLSKAGTMDMIDPEGQLSTGVVRGTDTVMVYYRNFG